MKQVNVVGQSAGDKQVSPPAPMKAPMVRIMHNVLFIFLKML